MLTERQFKDILNRIALHTDIAPDDIIGFQYDGKTFSVTWQWRHEDGTTDEFPYESDFHIW